MLTPDITCTEVTSLHSSSPIIPFTFTGIVIQALSIEDECKLVTQDAEEKSILHEDKDVSSLILLKELKYANTILENEKVINNKRKTTGNNSKWREFATQLS